MDAVINFFSRVFGRELATVLGSMIPLIELKGSILFGRGAGMGFWETLGLSYLGSTAVFFLLFFLLIPVLNLLKKWKFFNRLATGVEGYITERANKEIQKHKNASSVKIKMWTVFIFVAIPLPMTGVWMGSAIAVFLGMRFREAVLPVVLGNLCAGLIISLLAELFLPYVNYILYALFGIALVLLIVFIVKIVKKSKKKEVTDAAEQ